MNNPSAKTGALTLLLLLALGFFLADCDRQPYRQGAILYTNFCANCHMEDGSGLESLIPPLAGADYLREEQKLLPCIIRYGQRGPIVVNGRTYGQQEMPGVPELSDFEITNVINYINQAWGNDYGVVKYETVRQALESCE